MPNNFLRRRRRTMQIHVQRLHRITSQRLIKTRFSILRPRHNRRGGFLGIKSRCPLGFWPIIESHPRNEYVESCKCLHWDLPELALTLLNYPPLSKEFLSAAFCSWHWSRWPWWYASASRNSARSSWGTSDMAAVMWVAVSPLLCPAKKVNLQLEILICTGTWETVRVHRQTFTELGIHRSFNSFTLLQKQIQNCYQNSMKNVTQLNRARREGKGD